MKKNLLGTFSVIVLLGVAGVANAGVWTWNNTDGLWSDTNNWAGGSAPNGTDNTDQLIFGDNAGQIYTAVNDIPGPTVLNQITLNGTTAGITHTNIGNQIQFAGIGPQLQQNGANNFIFQNDVNLAADTTFGGSGSGTVTISGVIDGAGLIKNGGGVLELTGNNTYSGGTTVTNGTLTVNNATGPGTSGTGSGAVTVNNLGHINGSGTISGGITVNGGGLVNGSVTVHNGATVNSGGTLGGNASVSGNATINSGGNLAGNVQVTGGLTVKSGGTITPGGDGVAGIVTADSAVINGGAIYHWDRLGTGGPGVGWDLLNINAGVLDLSGLSATPGNTFVIDINGTSALGTYQIAEAFGGITGIFNPADFTLNNYAGGPGYWTISEVNLGGSAQALDLTYSIPEPSMAMLWCVGLGLLGLRFVLHRRAGLATS